MSLYCILVFAFAAQTCGGVMLPQRNDPGEMKWMHIPKAGTSFVIPLSVVVCPNIPEVVYTKMTMSADQTVKSLQCQCKACGCSSCGALTQFHTPYDQSHAGHMLGMFRNPAVRMVSQFMFKEGFGSGWGDMEEVHSFMQSLPSDTSDTQRFLKYAQHPTTLSCQTKMLLGFQCVSRVVLTPEDTKEAIRRLQEEFFFVGITDAWKESVELLHSTTGGGARSFETLNIRPGGKVNDEKRAEAETLLDELLKNAWSDPHDSEIFAEAARLMNERMGNEAVSPSLDRSKLGHGWWDVWDIDELGARDASGAQEECSGQCGA